MRGLTARRVASSALCASLLVGVVGAAAVAADSAGDRKHEASRLSAAEVDAVLGRTKELRELGAPGPALEQLAELIEQSLEDGVLTPEEAQQITDAVKAVIAEITSTIPGLPTPTALPTPTSLPTLPTSLPTLPTSLPTLPTSLPTLPTSLPTLPTSLPTLPTSLPTLPTPTALPTVPGLPTEELAALEEALQGLLAAVTTGDVGQVVSATRAVLTALVDLLDAALPGGGLPTPTGLPTVLPTPTGLPTELPTPTGLPTGLPTELPTPTGLPTSLPTLPVSLD
ncbi:hypothetical protein [Streptomyces sp. NPDC086787]|uniref:hypothetical protein n=1 Tax=Streptomyces sp. NPDC086787 TaxID=3365759 RepID=UPI0038005F04